MKQCTLCDTLLDLGEFCKDVHKPDGRTSWCKPCLRARRRDYYARNKITEYARNKAYLAVWRKLNPGKEKATMRRYRAKNPGTIRALNAKHRAIKLRAAPSWLSSGQLAEMRAIYLAAQELTKRTGVRHDVDHIVPLKGVNVCGLHVPWNLRVLEHHRNLSKGNKMESQK